MAGPEQAVTAATYNTVFVLVASVTCNVTYFAVPQFTVLAYKPFTNLPANRGGLKADK